ncbi:MAG: hypothetical protein ACUVTZ_08340, partial [Armatimonadota bacterium]
GIAEEGVDEKVAERLRAVSGAGKSALQVVLAPASEEAVGEPSRASLVLLPLQLSDPQQWMKRVVDKTTRRNMLIFLAPEKEGEGRLRAAVKRLLALEAVEHAGMFRELDREDQDEVKDQLKEKQAEVDGLLFSLYSRVFRPAPEGVQELRVLLKRDAKTLAEAVESALKEQEILTYSISPEYLTSMLDTGERPFSLAEAQTVLMGSPGQPIVPDPQRALHDATRKGVEQSKFAVKSGDQTFTQQVPEDVLTRPDLTIVPLPPQPPPRTVTRWKLRVECRGGNTYPLRKALDLIQGRDAAIRIDIEGEAADWLEEVEKVLGDYSVPYVKEEAEQASP